MRTILQILVLILIITNISCGYSHKDGKDNLSHNSDKQINQDTIHHARESQLRADSHRKSLEKAAKMKALIESNEKLKIDSIIFINGLPCVIRKVVKPTAKLQFLKDSEGKFPHEIGLLRKDVFKQRLKKLLGKRSSFLMKYFNVVSTIENNNEIFIVSGCQARNCDKVNFMIGYDFSNDILHVGVREDEQIIIYSENGDVPAEIINGLTEILNRSRQFGFSQQINSDVIFPISNGIV